MTAEPSAPLTPAILDGSLAKLRAWASVPAPAAGNEGDERARAIRTVFVLSLGLIAMTAFSLVQAWMHHWKGTAWTKGVEELCLIGALWLNRQGEVEWATKIICFSELVSGLIVTCYFGAGFSDEELLLFPLTLVAAAVLLNWRTYIGFATLVMVSVASAGLILAATNTPGNGYHRVVNVINILLITIIAVGLLSRNLKKSVSQSREAEREIKALSGRLMHARDEERARLARELHDDLSQQIAALSIGMSNLKRQIPQEQADARDQSDRIQNKLVHVSESIRRLSHELHPSVLEHSGLAAAVRQHCTECTALTGIKIALQIDGDLEGLPPDVALCVYRIVQEALRNVVRHAKVNAAQVEIRRTAGILCLTVSDQGVGIAPDRAAAASGLGLVSIKERTRLVNGAVDIQSQPNRGTTLRVRIPCH